ncbi:MAG: hypothetical protein FWC47_14300, partial [Oscillospiraceae bacterium]|nr:hypothetical protein [Oscillospiraceae bacterium]
HGLSNQGWKDSGDSIVFHDGRLAEAPIALCEVQGYAYAAAIAGSELLDHFGRAGGEEWRTWAKKLQKNFMEKFWIDDIDGGYPAVALDKNKAQVDSLTSNIGHLLTTGILDESHAARVAALLVGPELNSGFGLRTLSSAEKRYWPLSYHCGSVWPHDTVICIMGLIKSGFKEQAAKLIEGMLKAAESFNYRIPELYSGDGADIWRHPVEYSAACTPLCWSASASIATLGAILGLVPVRAVDGSMNLEMHPMNDFGDINVSGLRIGDRVFEVNVDSHDYNIRQIL